MVYELTCPKCGLIMRSAFVRVGAVAVCTGCRGCFKIQEEHIRKQPAAISESTLGLPTPAEHSTPTAEPPTPTPPPSSEVPPATSPVVPAATSVPTPSPAVPAATQPDTLDDVIAGIVAEVGLTEEELPSAEEKPVVARTRLQLSLAARQRQRRRVWLLVMGMLALGLIILSGLWYGLKSRPAAAVATRPGRYGAAP